MEVVDEVRSLLDAEVGPGVLTDEEIAEYVASDTATVFVAATTGSGELTVERVTGPDGPPGDVVGASIGREFARTAALTEHPYFHSDPDDLVATVDLPDERFPVGSVLVTCVAADRRGQGLGSDLAYAALERLFEDGLTSILQLEWDRPDSPGVEKMRSMGYEPRARLEDHFPAGWGCSTCEAECTCDVVAFLL